MYEWVMSKKKENKTEDIPKTKEKRTDRMGWRRGEAVAVYACFAHMDRWPETGV